MASHVFRIEPSRGVWIIRHNSVHAAHCPDRDSALRLALALARGEHARSGEAVVVHMEEADGRESPQIEVSNRD